MTPLLTKKQAAEYLGVSTRTIESWVADRKVPYVKPGGRVVRFKESDLLAYVERRTVKARAY